MDPFSTKNFTECFGTGCLIITFLLVTIVLIAMQFITENPETELYLAEHKNLVDDWNQQPIVDVIVVDGD